jgi:endonuclease G
MTAEPKKKPRSRPRTTTNSETSPPAGSLSFRTHFRSPELSQLEIPVEIRRPDLSVVARTTSSQTVPGLEAGEYIVMARLPAGQLLTASAQVVSGETRSVALEPDADDSSVRDSDEVPHFIGPPRRSALPPQAQVRRGEWASPVATPIEEQEALLSTASTRVPSPAALWSGVSLHPILESLGIESFSLPEEPGAFIVGEEGTENEAIDLLLGEYARLEAEVQSETPAVLPSPPLAVELPVDALPLTPGMPEAPKLPDVRLRLFQGNVLTGKAIPVPADQLPGPIQDDRGLRLHVPGASQTSALQILVPGYPGINLMLPVSAGESCEIVMSPLSAAPAPGEECNLALEVYLKNIDANALLRYRAQGLASDAAAATASENQALSAKQLLHGKEREPIAATVGAYALLRFNRLERLHEWTKNLYEWCPTLPDGAAIYGEHLARLGRHAEAVDVFLTLAERGLPLFTEGIDCAMERLDIYIRLYLEPEGRKGPLDEARYERARVLLELLRRFSTFSDHRRFTVRYTGLSPNAPGGEVWSPRAPASIFPAPATPETHETTTLLKGGRMPLSPEMLSQTEQRYQTREARRTENVHKIEAAKKGEGRLLDVDDPQRVALRTQRILAQPATIEALGATQGGSLESLGTVDTEFLERIIGGSNLLGIAFLEVGTTVANTVGRIHINNQFQTVGFGTGFLVSPRLLLTNNHVLSSREAARFSVVEFLFQNGVDGRPLATHTFELQPDVFFATQPTLDFTLVAVAEQSRPNGNAAPVPLARFGFNRLSRDQGKILIGECINVIQHPDGKPKQIALQQNELIDRLDDFLHYKTDTAPGSSGSPLYNNQWEVVGLHHSGVPERTNGQIMSIDGIPWTPDMGETKVKWIANEGARISSILAQAPGLPGLTPEQRRLLEEMLNPATTVPVPIAPPVPTPLPVVQPPEAAVSPKITPPPVETAKDPSPALDLSATGTAGADGAVTLTIPLQITVRVGGMQAGSSVGITASLPAVLVEEAVSIDPDYSNRTGYDPSFLGTPVLLPVLTAAQRANAALNQLAAQGQDATLLNYHHYSVVMNKQRRLAFYTVVNIDGNIHRNLERDEDRWILDPRIRKDEQIGGSLYAGNDFDQGHLVRRLDPAWGSDEQTARVANDDTFHYTNCSPQHKNFNRNASLWAGLENFILDNARAQRLRVTVFNGPVLAGTDPVFKGVQIPLAFWKIMVFRKPDGQLSASAYLISQKKLVEAMLQEAFTPQTFQVPVRKISELTGLDFSPLSGFDPLNGDFQESAMLREEAGIPAAGREIANYGSLAL